MISVVREGFDQTYVLNMDMLSFESLHASLVRLKAVDDQHDMMHDRIAAHGDKKAITQWEKLTKKQAELDLRPEGATDKDAFIARLGGKGM